jgi:D-lactate dehydrogenase (cytochrome)
MSGAPVAGAAASADALARIREVVGRNGWSTDPAELAPRLEEARGLFHGRCLMLVSPASTAELAAVVRICAKAGIPIVPQGGNTGRCGGAVPHPHGREILLSLHRLNRIRAVDPVDYTITVEAGVVLARVQAAAEEVDRLFPLSLGAEGSCQIGGNLSSNAGGNAVLRYGNARDLALGLEVVLPDGRVWDGLRALRKDNTGYDLKHLFIGAEGTLGIITAAVLKLFPRPRDLATAFVAVTSPEAALALLARARAASGDRVTGFELIPRIGLEFTLAHVPGTVDPLAEQHETNVLVELSGAAAGMSARLEAFLAEAHEDGLVRDAAVAQSEAQRRAFWHLREAMVEAQTLEGASLKHDVSVPVSRVPAFLERTSARCRAALPTVRIVAFGHIGDGNIHFNLSQPIGMDERAFLARRPAFRRIVHDTACALGGSFSAEHGIGQLKRDELARYKSPVEIDLMRRIKAALDPAGLMNPGKVLPD